MRPARVASRGAVTILALLLGIQMAAAGLPDWAQRIAGTTPAPPEGLPKHPARVLFEETTVEVQPDGLLRVRYRRAAQALSPTAYEVGAGFFHFSDRTKFSKSVAWHLPPEGRTKKKKGASIDLTLDDSFLTSRQTRLVPVEGIEKGSLVFFEFEATEEPYQLAYQVLFYDDYPIETVRFVLEVDPSWEVRYDWPRGSGPEPTISGNSRIWEMNDLEPVEWERLGVPPSDQAPLLVVSFIPPTETAVKIAALPSWVSIAHWFERIARGRDEATPEVAAAAREATGEEGADFYAQVRAANAFVRDKVRYVAKAVGIGGYRPHAAGETLEHLYGDCKDKGTLLRAMLASLGHTSYPVLVSANASDTVSEDVACLNAFDHLVIAVPVPDEPPVPEDLANAVVDGGDLGRLLVLDPTDEYNSIGYLNAMLGGKRALVMAGDRSVLVDLPAENPAAHRVEKRFEAEIRTDLSLSLSLETHRYGNPAAESRAAYRDSARDYREARERDLLEHWPGGTLEDFTVDLETVDGAFHEKVSMSVAAPSSTSSVDLLRMFPGAIDDLPRLTLGRRKVPVQFEYPLTLRYEAAVRNVPDPSHVPSSHDIEGDGWSVKTYFVVEDDTLRGTWEATLVRRRHEPEGFRNLRKFWSAARRAAGTTVDPADQ